MSSRNASDKESFYRNILTLGEFLLLTSVMILLLLLMVQYFGAENQRRTLSIPNVSFFRGGYFVDRADLLPSSLAGELDRRLADREKKEGNRLVLWLYWKDAFFGDEFIQREWSEQANQLALMRATDVREVDDFVFPVTDSYGQQKELVVALGYRGSRMGDEVRRTLEESMRNEIEEGNYEAAFSQAVHVLETGGRPPVAREPVISRTERNRILMVALLFFFAGAGSVSFYLYGSSPGRD